MNFKLHTRPDTPYEPFVSQKEANACPTAEYLLRNHLFILAVIEVRAGLWAYKTRFGPIYAICAKPSIVKKYRKFGGFGITMFSCSHDLQGKDGVGLEFQEAIKKALGVKKPDFWAAQVMDAVEYLRKMEVKE